MWTFLTASCRNNFTYLLTYFYEAGQTAIDLLSSNESFGWTWVSEIFNPWIKLAGALWLRKVSRPRLVHGRPANAHASFKLINVLSADSWLACQSLGQKQTGIHHHHHHHHHHHYHRQQQQLQLQCTVHVLWRRTRHYVTGLSQFYTTNNQPHYYTSVTKHD